MINYNIKDLHEYAKSKGGICLSKLYTNTNVKYRWQCNCGYIWERSWSTTRSNKYFCIKCNDIYGNRQKKYKIEDLQKYAKNHEGECLSVEYINCNIKYKWKCKYGHVWKSVWTVMIKNKSWCDKCARIKVGVNKKHLSGDRKKYYIKYKISKLKSFTKHKNESISSGEACKIIACQPAQRKWEEIRGEYPKEPVLRTIINLEKLMHKKYIYAKSNVVVASAMFIDLDLNISKLCASEVSVRTLLKRLELWDKIMKHKGRHY